MESKPTFDLNSAFHKIEQDGPVDLKRLINVSAEVRLLSARPEQIEEVGLEATNKGSTPLCTTNIVV